MWVHDFFEHVLPALLRAGIGRAEEGSVYVAVDGAGEWTIFFGRSSRVEAGRGAGPEAELYFNERAFAAFLCGEDVLGRGAFAVGEPQSLERLAWILTPPARGIVALRASEREGSK